MKVLVVDDSSMMRRMLATHLGQFGITDIIEAGNGEDAITVLGENMPVDIVMLDWNMPVMDGLTCLKKIRSMPQYDKIKVVMCTSESEKKRIVEAVKEKANNYIVKPFTPEVLKEKLGL